MRTSVSLLSLLAVVTTGCQFQPDVQHPGEDKGGFGMRLQLVPTGKTSESSDLATVRRAMETADAGLATGTYLCTCPPPAPGDTSYTRLCECQVEGMEKPTVCGDGIINVETESCDPQHDLCPPGSHCNRGGEVGWDGVVRDACQNCIPNEQPDAGQ